MRALIPSVLLSISQAEVRVWSDLFLTDAWPFVPFHQGLAGSWAQFAAGRETGPSTSAWAPPNWETCHLPRAPSSQQTLASARFMHTLCAGDALHAPPSSERRTGCKSHRRSRRFLSPQLNFFLAFPRVDCSWQYEAISINTSREEKREKKKIEDQTLSAMDPVAIQAQTLQFS